MVTTFSLLLRSFGVNGFTELVVQREEITDSLASNFFGSIWGRVRFLPSPSPARADCSCFSITTRLCFE